MEKKRRLKVNLLKQVRKTNFRSIKQFAFWFKKIKKTEVQIQLQRMLITEPKLDDELYKRVILKKEAGPWFLASIFLFFLHEGIIEKF